MRGDDPLKITQRCRHATFSTTELYMREAEAVRDCPPPLAEELIGAANQARPGGTSR